MQNPGNTECDAQVCEVLRVVLVPHDAPETKAHGNQMFGGKSKTNEVATANVKQAPAFTIVEAVVR